MLIPSRHPDVHVRTRQELERAGCSRRAIEALCEEGTITRLGHGFYGTSLTPHPVRAALARNNRVTCVSALHLYGFWVPPVQGAHEARRRGGRRSRSSARSGAAVHLHHPVLTSWPDQHPVLPMPIALEHAVHCLSEDHAAVVLESGLNRHLIDDAAALRACSSLSERRRSRILPLDGSAESGTETIVRRALERRGVRVRTQVSIPGIGRVDMIVGEKLIIECDSFSHHTDPEAYRRDRRRDRRARRRGYIVLRLTYEDVMANWEETLADLLLSIRRGDHRIARSQLGALEDGLLSDPLAG